MLANWTPPPLPLPRPFLTIEPGMRSATGEKEPSKTMAPLINAEELHDCKERKSARP
jgi:hypothetical protein